MEGGHPALQLYWIVMIFAAIVLAATPKYQTWFFVTSDCPIAQRFTPEIKRIMKEYQAVSDFQYVYEDEDATMSKMKAHHAEYKLNCPLILDPKHAKAKKFKIKGVPTAVVMATEDMVFYQGRIDDSYGKDFKWHPAKNADLRNALSALKNGKPVPVKSTTVIGCALGS